MLRLGYSFQCGLVLGSLLTFFYGGLVFYGMWLFIECVMATKKATMSEIAAESIGRAGHVVVLCLGLLATCLTVQLYLLSCTDNLRGVIQYAAPLELPAAVYDHFTMATLVMICLFAPTDALRRRQSFFYVALFGMGCIVYVLAHYIYMITQHLNDWQYSDIRWLNFGPRVLDCTAALGSAYCIQPIGYPGLVHFQQNGPRALFRTYLVSFILMAVFMVTFGCLAHIADPLASSNTLVMDAEGVEQTWYVWTARIAMIGMMLASAPIWLAPAKHLIASQFMVVEQASGLFWFSLGLLLLIAMMSLSRKEGRAAAWIGVIGDVACIAHEFLIPVVLFWCTFREGRKVHKVFSLLLGLFGLVVCAQSFYLSWIYL
jgi:hypothetical protein